MEQQTKSKDELLELINTAPLTLLKQVCKLIGFKGYVTLKSDTLRDLIWDDTLTAKMKITLFEQAKETISGRIGYLGIE